MKKLRTGSTQAAGPAPRVAEKARIQAQAELDASAHAQEGLNELAWLLDGNASPIPAEVLERLNGPCKPRH